MPAPPCSATGESPHLCQPDSGKSCGACCGLYNYRGTSRPQLERRLKRRTEAFHRLQEYTPGTLKGFSNWVRSSEPGEKLLETIYNCEFLGFLDPACRRVGCLLHPCRHKGADLRDCSFYGADLCDGHLCLSYQKLTREEKWAVIQSLDDWYLYGICITDIDLCKSFFGFASERLGAAPSLSLISLPAVRRAAGDFFSLKISWPFRTDDEGRFGKYCLAEDEYREARIPYEEIGCGKSRYDRIFLSLASDFSSVEELRRAERLIEDKIAAFVQSCRTEVGLNPAETSSEGQGLQRGSRGHRSVNSRRKSGF